ncbi:MAG: thioredoxin, partial [Gammaproteobacteria bacterium]|nr:thioredoxin [Gammaproteobacteria bacterium]
PPARLGQAPRCGSCHEPLFAGKPMELNHGNFSKVVSKTDVPVVVDFWAAWCGPCKMMAPFFEQAAARVEPKVRLAKLDTEAAPEIAGQFGIRSIPTLIVLKNGREVARQAGAMDLNNLVRFIEANL